MNTLHKSETSAKELNKQIEQHLEELAQATNKARTSEEMLHYLDFCAKFHEYSTGNIWLIMLARPDATYVAGFHKWKSMGRWVRKGEHGIPILAPVLIKEKDEEGLEEKRLVGFRVVYVFDVSQTNGEPLPPVPDWKSPEKNLELQKKLIDFAKANGIKVTIETLAGDTQGVSMGGSIVLSPEAGTKTLIHEIAHEFLHHVENNQLSRAEKEMEAESVAYVVCSYLGFRNLSSPNYLALQGMKNDGINTHFQIISNLAKKLIIVIRGESNNFL
jgi:hypothetical protein